MEAHEDDQPEIEIQHPLENSLILDRVFDSFQPLATFEDWKTIRAVCKTWNFSTLSKWRASAVLNLKLGPTLDINQPGNSGVSISEFQALIENDNSSFFRFTEKPFQKHKLHNLVLYVFSVKKNSVFCTSVGPNIRHLSLHDVDIQTITNSMSEVMDFFVNQTPNLESISANNVYIDGKRFGQPPRTVKVHPNVKRLCILNCFAFGFKNFPNLEEVTLNSCGYRDIAYLMESHLPKLGEPGDFSNSSIVRLKLQKLSKNKNAFYDPRFTALKHLSVETASFMNSIFLSEFISNHAETLETIEAFGSKKLFISNISCLISVNIPNLTELRVYGNVFSNLNFIQYTPNLKLLHLDLFGFEKQEKMKMDLDDGLDGKLRYLTDWDLVGNTRFEFGVEQTTWKSMHYFQINYELKKHDFESLSNWMPNLKTLKTVLSIDTFPVVCDNWPELEHLECMFGSSISNESITGITDSSSGGQRSKALVDMNNLTTFKCHTECNKSLLSDDSVVAGFLRVPKLTNLSICVSSEFSEDAEILLRRRIQSVKVQRNYTSNPLHKNWQCCQDTEYKNFLFDRAEDIFKVDVEYSDSDSDSDLDLDLDLDLDSVSE